MMLAGSGLQRWSPAVWYLDDLGQGNNGSVCETESSKRC